MELRIGNGFDVHPFTEGRRLILGGVHVPHPFGLRGHSDADVLVHAVIDSLLGAASLGDIGEVFPDSDPANSGRSSIEMLAVVGRLLAEKDFRVVSLDTTLIAQAPKISPYRRQMQENISGALVIAPRLVGVKATTTEKLGFTGRGEGIAALATSLIEHTGEAPQG
jgi:2-C-methyl-D-erythritol 2,4-cyclodiphosphate synthase